MYKRLFTLIAVVALITPVFAVASYYPAGGGTYRLQTSVGTTNTTIRLSSFTEPVSGNKYSMTYFNSNLQCGTLDPQTSRSEFILFTGVTQNADGSAILTGVTRGLGRAYPYTASTTLAQAHPGQSVFILSDSPCLFNQYSVKQNDEAITGAWTVPTPTASGGVANKSYVDSVVAGVVSADKVTVAATAGESYATGTIVYFRRSDARWWMADTDVEESVQYSIIGIAQGSGTAGVAISGGVLTYGLDTTQVGLTPGVNYFVSSTAGATTTATTSVGIGKARSATSLYVDSHFYGIQPAGNNTFSGINTFTNTVTLSGATSNIASTTVYATTTTGTWTKPSNLKYAIVETIGGGGGSGGCTDISRGAGGGGGGGYSREVLPAAAITSTVVVTIGAAGSAGAVSNGTGGTGGTSSFGSFLQSTGGAGGVGCAVASANAGGVGGSGSGGDFNLDGGDGSYGWGDFTTATAGAIGGAGGDSVYGQGAPMVATFNANTIVGVAGKNYGGGGSGSANANSAADTAGALGAQGLVLITSVFF